MVAVDLYQSAKARRFFKEGYEEEKRRRAEYRSNKIVILLNLEKELNHIQDDSAELFEYLVTRLDRIDHDHQQQKTRQTWSKKREKKDLNLENTPFSISKGDIEVLRKITKGNRGSKKTTNTSGTSLSSKTVKLPKNWGKLK